MPDGKYLWLSNRHLHIHLPDSFDVVLQVWGQMCIRDRKAAVEKGDVYNVRDLAISLKTLFEARNFLLKFEAAQIYYTQCYDNQSRASRKHQANGRICLLYTSCARAFERSH